MTVGMCNPARTMPLVMLKQVFMNWTYASIFQQLFVLLGGLEYEKDGGARRKVVIEPLGGTKPTGLLHPNVIYLVPRSCFVGVA